MKSGLIIASFRVRLKLDSSWGFSISPQGDVSQVCWISRGLLGNYEGCVITGAMTEYCMDTTARRVTIMGYDVTVVSDAHTIWDRDMLPAVQTVSYYNDILGSFGTREHVIMVEPRAEITY